MDVLYSTLLGKYEQLNEVPQGIARGVRAVLFTDQSDLVSESWEVVVVEPAFPQDLIRSQRLIKILGHPLLRPYSRALYIDNSVELLETPTTILDRWLRSAPLAFPLHSFHDSLEMEFQEVRRQTLDSRERLDEQYGAYAAQCPQILQLTPLWTGIFARTPVAAAAKFFQIWSNHVLRYSRRDQLSILVAELEAGVPIERIALDNNLSESHRWPVRIGKQDILRKSALEDYRRLYEETKVGLDDCHSRTCSLEAELQAVRSSPPRRSWIRRANKQS